MLVTAALFCASGALMVRGASVLSESISDRTTPRVFNLPISVNTEYHASVSVGTPPQQLEFWMDTGSASIWTYTQACAASCGQVTRTPFLSDESTTFKDLSTPESVEYLGGTISGTLYSDYLTLDRVKFPQRQNAIQVDSSNWAWLQADGIIGLGFQDIGVDGTSVLSSIFHPSVVQDHKFGVYWGYNMSLPSNSAPLNNGVFTIGGSNTEFYEPDKMVWIDVIPQPGVGDWELWMAYLVSMTFTANYSNGTSSVNVYEINDSIIFDTGSDLASLPTGIPESIYAAMGIDFVQGGRPLCADYLQLNMTLDLLFANDVKVTFDTRDMAEPGYTEDEYCWPVFEDWDSSWVIIGTSLLRNMYTIFDLGAWDPVKYKPRIGLAHLKEEFRPFVV